MMNTETKTKKYKCRCLVCGTDFYSHYMTSKFCSDECRESAAFHYDFGCEEVSKNMRFDISWVDNRKKTEFDKKVDATTPQEFIEKKKQAEIEMFARVEIPEEILLIQKQRMEKNRNGQS